MNEQMVLNFPDLLYLQDYKGNFETYFKAIYSVFESDFIKSTPFFRKNKVQVKKYPEVNGLHRTFYHITHEGNIEKERTPDIQRMERIRFPKFIIDNHKHPEVLIWENIRKAEKRVLLFNEAENYLVVLSERKGYYLFWTAYVVDRKHQKEKLIKEYQIYKNTETA